MTAIETLVDEGREKGRKDTDTRRQRVKETERETTTGLWHPHFAGGRAQSAEAPAGHRVLVIAGLIEEDPHILVQQHPGGEGQEVLPRRPKRVKQAEL